MTGQIDNQQPAGVSAGGEQPRFTSTVPVDTNLLHDVHSLRRTDPESIRFDRIGNLPGQYIGNTDMHVGNLSFFTGTTEARRPSTILSAPPHQPSPGHVADDVAAHIIGGRLALDPVRPQLQPPGVRCAVCGVRQYAEKARQMVVADRQQPPNCRN